MKPLNNCISLLVSAATLVFVFLSIKPSIILFDESLNAEIKLPGFNEGIRSTGRIYAYNRILSLNRTLSSIYDWSGSSRLKFSISIDGNHPIGVYELSKMAYRSKDILAVKKSRANYGLPEVMH